MAKQYRQGDWLLIKVDTLPEGTRSEERDAQGRLIVGEGEATGHAHAVLNNEAEIMVLDNIRWLLAPEPVELVHEEHDTITLPSGIYELRRQREFHRGEERRVLD